MFPPRMLLYVRTVMHTLCTVSKGLLIYSGFHSVFRSVSLMTFVNVRYGIWVTEWRHFNLYIHRKKRYLVAYVHSSVHSVKLRLVSNGGMVKREKGREGEVEEESGSALNEQANVRTRKRASLCIDNAHWIYMCTYRCYAVAFCIHIFAMFWKARSLASAPIA